MATYTLRNKETDAVEDFTMKISEYDEFNNNYLQMKEKIQKKGEMLDGNNEILKIQKAINSLKQDISDLNVRQSLVENRITKYKKCTTKNNLS